ncbi:MAG: hypothetical protein ACE5E7_00350 [Anaerolineae bacterium]
MGDVSKARVSVLSGVILFALALSRYLETPVRPLVQTTVLGSPIVIGITASTLMLPIVLGITITGVMTLIRTHPHGGIEAADTTIMSWIVPALLNVAFAGWLSRIQNTTAWTAAILGCALLIPLALIAEYRSLDNTRQHAALQWSQMALAHLAAVILFTLIYDARIRSILSGTAVLLVTFLLSARLFWAYHKDISRAFQYGGVVGLILAQLIWALNYWRLSGLQGGLYLLSTFYLLVGLIQQQLQNQLNQRTVVEYTVVALLTLSLTIAAVP